MKTTNAYVKCSDIISNKFPKKIYCCTRNREGCTKTRPTIAHGVCRGSPRDRPLQLCACTYLKPRNSNI